MDENNNGIENENENENGEQPEHEMTVKPKKTCAAYFITIVIMGVLVIASGGEYWMLVLLLLCIPYGIVGLITWAIVRKNDRSVALGILLGSITPFIVLLIVTGGCGLFMFS